MKSYNDLLKSIDGMSSFDGYDWLIKSTVPSVGEEDYDKLYTLLSKSKEYTYSFIQRHTSSKNYAEILYKIIVLNQEEYMDRSKNAQRNFISNCRSSINHILNSNDDKFIEFFFKASISASTMCMEKGILTIDELYEHSDLISSANREILVIDLELRQFIKYYNKYNQVIFSCDNIVFVGGDKNTFKQINCDIICRSDATKEEIKDNMNEVKSLVRKKLSSMQPFKKSPELLKHIKIANMYYNGKGILKVIIEWKESFAYED